MNKYHKNIYYCYIAIAFLFLIFTTNYLSLYDIIYVTNQTDVISYSEIAKKAPNLPHENKIIIQHVAQRFLIHFLVGSIANLTNIDFFIIYKIVTFVFIILYIFLIVFISKKFKFNLKESILFFSLLFLNPYITRYHIFQPVQAHDMLFFCCGLFFAYSIIKQKYVANIITTLIAVFLRQTSIAMFIGSLINLIINKKIKLLVLLIITYVSFFYLTIYFGKIISINSFPTHLAYKLFFYDFTQVEKLIKFLLLGVFPFLPLTVLLFGQFNNFKTSVALTLFLVCAAIIGQPILGGPDGSVNNVGRIANLCYPILTLLIFYVFNFKKFVKNNYFFYIFIIGIFFWSLHPTYSIFDFFGVFRFYNY